MLCSVLEHASKHIKWCSSALWYFGMKFGSERFRPKLLTASCTVQCPIAAGMVGLLHSVVVRRKEWKCGVVW